MFQPKGGLMLRDTLPAGNTGKKVQDQKAQTEIRGKKVYVLYIRYGFYLHLVGMTDSVVPNKEQKNCIVVSTSLSPMFFPRLLSLDVLDIENEGLKIETNLVERTFWPKNELPGPWGGESVDLSKNTPPKRPNFSWDEKQ
jgi:hypothetical protein